MMPSCLSRIVEFADRRGMDYALEKLDNTDLDGRKIKLVEEKRSSRRSRSASKSRFRDLYAPQMGADKN